MCNIYNYHSMHLSKIFVLALGGGAIRQLKTEGKKGIYVSHLTQWKTTFQTVLELKTTCNTKLQPQEPLYDICSLQSEGAFWSLMTQIRTHCVNLMAACAAQRWLSSPQAMNTFLKMAPTDQTGPEQKANKDWPLAPLLFPHFHR